MEAVALSFLAKFPNPDLATFRTMLECILIVEKNGWYEQIIQLRHTTNELCDSRLPNLREIRNNIRITGHVRAYCIVKAVERPCGKIIDRLGIPALADSLQLEEAFLQVQMSLKRRSQALKDKLDWMKKQLEGFGKMFALPLPQEKYLFRRRKELLDRQAWTYSELSQTIISFLPGRDPNAEVWRDTFTEIHEQIDELHASGIEEAYKFIVNNEHEDDDFVRHQVKERRKQVEIYYTVRQEMLREFFLTLCERELSPSTSGSPETPGSDMSDEEGA